MSIDLIPSAEAGAALPAPFSYDPTAPVPPLPSVRMGFVAAPSRQNQRRRRAMILATILFYVGSFSVGLGPGVWVVISELFPTRIRGRAMSIATVSLWLACILVAATYLSLVEAVGSTGAFWLYAATSVVNFFFIWRVMPETRGRSLEEIERSW